MPQEIQPFSDKDKQKIQVLALGVGILAVTAVAFFGENDVFMRSWAAALSIGSFVMAFVLMVFMLRSEGWDRQAVAVVLMLLAIGIGSGTSLISETVGPFWKNSLYGLTLLLAATSYLLRWKKANPVTIPKTTV